jgi:RimJ/RimL family protein N-acetyltransferase
VIVWDRPEEVGRWVCERNGGSFSPESTAIGVESDGQLIGGVMFDSWNGNSICLHVAGQGNWYSRSFGQAVFGYAFGQLKVKNALAPVDSTNEKSRRFCERIGFRLEATITSAGKTGDLLVFSMTPDECRWLGDK